MSNLSVKEQIKVLKQHVKHRRQIVSNLIRARDAYRLLHEQDFCPWSVDINLQISAIDNTLAMIKVLKATL